MTESFASYVVDILGDGGHVFSETELQPAPVKTPLDEARERLADVDDPIDARLEDIRLVLNRLDELERQS